MIKKAGTILLDKDNKKIALVYRKKHDDISFPKGHLEDNETFEECAIRETLEETGRICEIIKPIYLNKYMSKEGEVENHMFLAIDKGLFNTNIDEELLWISIDKVKDYLKYDELKIMWNEIYSDIENELKTK